MEQSISLDDFFSYLSSAGLQTGAEQRAQLRKYLDLVLLWSQKQNLVSRNDLGHIVERHFLPSAFLSTQINPRAGMKILDIGSGAGFPGMITALLLPDLKLTLIDSSRKKYLFLREICDVLGTNTEIICERMESYVSKKTNEFDAVVSRAVTTLDKLWSWSNDLLSSKGTLIAMKGGDLAEELAMIESNSIMIKIIEPDKIWVRFSENLANKKLVIMEKMNV